MTVVAHNRFFDKDLEVATIDRNDNPIYVDLLTPFADHLKKRIKSKRQNIIAVVGGTGSGKSTLAIQLCRRIDPKWDLAENYIYSTEDLKRKLSRPDSNPINLFDEGSVSLNSSNSMQKDDKMMVVLFDTMRSRGWTTIICIPSLDSLNKRIRTYHLDYLVMCPNVSPVRGYDKRGFATIYEHVLRDWGQPWDRPIGTTLFDKLPPRIDKEYQAIKTEHQNILIRKFIEGEKIE